MVLSRWANSREDARPLKRLFEKLPEPGAPLGRRAQPLHEGAPTPDLPRQQPLGSSQDLHDRGLPDGCGRPQVGQVGGVSRGKRV